MLVDGFAFSITQNITQVTNVANFAVWTTMHVPERVKMLASRNTAISKVSKLMDMEAVEMVVSKAGKVSSNVCCGELASLLETNDSFGS